ncbi:MAG: hypothetical protein LIP02_03295 [Bacteroidales bacterium]|nr:hypothetical protein [Bacteroidales bacterium]
MILATVLSLLGFNAAAFQITVEVNDPSQVTVQSWYYYSIDKTTYSETRDVDFGDGNSALVEFDDQCTLRYIYVTPDAEAGIVTKSYKIYNEEGEVIQEMTYTGTSLTTSRKTISIPLTADWGRLVIETGTISADKSVTVTLNGDPSKVKFSMYATPVTLTEGQQTINYADNQVPIYIQPNGVSLLYKVTLNGTEVDAAIDWEGLYQYTIYQNDGDQIVIDTEFPEIYYNVSISVNDGSEGVIQSVRLDGTSITDWTAFQAKIASKLVMGLDMYNYSINSMTVNGEAVELWDGSYSKLVMSDLAIAIDATPIVRTDRVITYTTNWSKVNNYYDYYGYEMTNDSGNLIELASGYGEMWVCSDDNPFSFRCFAEEEGTLWVYLNNQMLESEWGVYEFNLKDGDVFKVFLQSEVPSYSVTFVLDGFSADYQPVVTTDRITVLPNLDPITVLTGTEVKIAPQEGMHIYAVDVDDVPVTAAEDGSYTVTITANSVINISGKESGITSIEAAAEGTHAIYNLQGQRLTTPIESLPAGLYIIDGNKVYVK